KTCASARAEGASAPCCETGCVLDNYFDITPPRSDLPPTSALIYENDAKDAVLLAGLCRDHRMAASVAGDAQEAARLLASRHWDFAIVNTELEPIAVPPGTRTMIICRSSVATVARVLAYRPASVITKPFDSTKLSQGFIRAMRLSFGYSTLSAMSTNFSMTLQNFEAALTGWAAEEHNRQNLPASVKYFCENACPQARTREAIPPAELEQYRLLNPFSERGALYCRHRTDCRLWKFQEQVPAEACTFAPVGMLCTDGVTSPETGLLKTIVMIEENVAKTMQRVDRLRLDYCTGQCDQRREDLAPRKGDTIFSSFRESLTRNCFSYCPQQDCPLMCFFEYFRRTIL
ncbi:MAG: hypothetical protein HGA80_09660, partial [Candidatus Omnitrophica bacterium]|nr:hypothetical protein [Candidatus Omnitrophota bacterium]